MPDFATTEHKLQTSFSGDRESTCEVAACQTAKHFISNSTDLCRVRGKHELADSAFSVSPSWVVLGIEFVSKIFPILG